MNVIHQLQAENAAQAAEITSLRAGLADLNAYVSSEKFTGSDGRVSCQDIINWVMSINGNAEVARVTAEYNGTGPRIADGSHTGCTHGTYPGVPQVNGYHCRVCGDALPGEWNDTEARAQERMRQHWIAFHKVVPGAPDVPTHGVTAPRGWDMVTA